MDPCINIPFLGLPDPVAAATHGLALAATCATALPLWRRSRGDSWRRATVVVFAASTALVFLASTAYHSVASPDTRLLLRHLDHAAIYVLIAGTFTPIAGNLVGARLRAFVLGVVWTLAVCGIVLKTCFFGATSEAVDVTFYLSMGWFGAVPCVPILRARPLDAAAMILGGASFYTAGALSELFGWPVFLPGVLGFHEVFHVFVVAASACFAAFVFRYVVPAPPVAVVVAGVA